LEVAGAEIGGAVGDWLTGPDVVFGTSASEVGANGEINVRLSADIGDKTPIQWNGKTLVPDGLTNTTVSEVKNVGDLSFTQQLRDYADFAQQTGRTFNLYTRPNTNLSGPLKEAISKGLINRQDIK